MTQIRQRKFGKQESHAIKSTTHDCYYHRLLYTWIGHEISGTAIRVVIAVDDGFEIYLSRAENTKL